MSALAIPTTAILVAILAMSTDAGADGGWHFAGGSGNPSSYLQGVSCATSTFCIAVGGTASSGTPNPVIEEYGGSTWVPVSSSNPGVELTGVSCASVNWCMAVGSDNGYFYSELYNRSGWSVPVSTLGNSASAMSRISCPSSTFCLAVGGNVVSFDGQHWASVPSPTAVALYEVSCVSETFCMALGQSSANQSTPEVYDGSQWRTTSALEGQAFLSAISCVSASFCVAAGTQGAGTFVGEIFNGSAWSMMQSVSTTLPAPVVTDIECRSTLSCEAVGYSRQIPPLNGPIEDSSVIWSFDGVSWRVMPNPPESFGDTSTLNVGSQGGATQSIGYDLSAVGCIPETLCVADGRETLPAGQSSVTSSLIITNKQVVSITAAVAAGGYWITSANGGVWTFGSASSLDSAANLALSSPIVGMAATPAGKGYWEVASDGGVFSFGDATFYGSAA